MIILNIYVILFSKKYIFQKDSLKNVKTEYAVIPGAGLTKDKKPSRVLSDRLDGALLLYEKGLVEKFIVSGDHKGDSYSETEAMEKYLLEHNVPRDLIFRDDAGFSTFETVYNSKKQFNVESAYFISQSFHLPRLLFISRRFGINAYGFECNFQQYNKRKHAKWRLREIPSRVKDFLWATYYILFKKI